MTQAPTSLAESMIVASGGVVLSRLYDLADSVDLDRVERDLRESASRPRFTRAKPKSVYYATPPVDVALGRRALELAGATRQVEARLRLYDFGAARLTYELPVERIEWRAYLALVNEMEDALERTEPWEADIARIRELTRHALTNPSASGLEVDYVFANVQSFDPPLLAEDVLTRLDLVPLLTGDVKALAMPATEDVLEHAYSYYADDLVVIGPYRALIVEPRGDPDVGDLLGMAQAQLLELLYYNDRLDDELPRMYDRIEEARQRFGGLARRRYAALARSLHALLAEVTELHERIENALVVTEDVYLAKVYEAALEQYRVRAWSSAVDRKLAIIRDSYTALYDEATSARAEYLEATIVLLIVLEIVLAFVL